jgi:hypothetical protein
MLRKTGTALAAALLTLLAAATPTTAATTAATPGTATTHRAASGEVCFWTRAGQHGESWCYRPTGYAEVPAFLHDNAAAFHSWADIDVYAIDWARDACYWRLIRAGDLADNWPWGARIDGVSHETMGCQPG